MNHIFYNNLNERNLTEEVVRQIKEAKTWIKACNLLFDDADIREALIEALTRGVALFILTNLEGSTGEVYTNNLLGKSVALNKPLRTFCILPPSKSYMMQEPIFPALMVFMLNFF